jgi:hypothetical protein
LDTFQVPPRGQVIHKTSNGGLNLVTRKTSGSSSVQTPQQRERAEISRAKWMWKTVLCTPICIAI